MYSESGRMEQNNFPRQNIFDNIFSPKKEKLLTECGEDVRHLCLDNWAHFGCN